MSSSIQIPRRRRKLTNLERDQAASGASGFSPETPDRFSAGSYGSEKGEGEVKTPTAASRPARRLSLLSKFTNSQVTFGSGNDGVYGYRLIQWIGTSIARAEHTVVNVGSPEAPRLVSWGVRLDRVTRS
jgi:hypothetical protein